MIAGILLLGGASVQAVEVNDAGPVGGNFADAANGDITDNGLAFAPGVDTNLWSFAIDNSGVNGRLAVSAPPPPPPQIDVTLTVGDTKRQLLKYGLDYERLWFWYGSTANKNLAAEWSVVDCDIDYIRCAINCGYELTEGVYDLSAYTSKIIPMMTAMQNANPHIKWFASPRPLNEAESGADWQPYPRWITGQGSNGESFDFSWQKCAEFLLRYLILMDSYGFKITYLDVTNEWQGNYGGRVTPPDVSNIRNYLIANLPTTITMPLIIAPSAWSFSQGKSWINSASSQGKLDGFDIAACHNTGKQGTPQDFADAANALGKEVWDSEVHGWKGSTPTDEIPNSFQMFDRIRAGFTGLDSWLTIGTTAQGHCYLLNNGTTVTRNVKYYIFRKLTTTSNFGRALDINQPSQFTSAAALVRENLLTVWVLNTSGADRYTEVDIGDRTMSTAAIARTRWNANLALEGVGDTITAASNSMFRADIEAHSLYCFEVEIVPTGSDFPFLEAENYTAMSGISVQPCADTGEGEMVAFSDAGDEVSFDVDVTRRGNYHVGFRAASASADITFELLDGNDVVARVSRMATGDPQNWTTLDRTIPLDTGSTTLTIRAAGGGWNLNWMEYSAVFVPPALENIAMNQSARASNVHSAGYEAGKAVDGDPSTRWATSTNPAWLEINFRAPIAVNKTSILDYGDRIKSYAIQYYDGAWITAYIVGDPDDQVEYEFPIVMASRFRLQTLTSTGNPSVWEFSLCYDPNLAPSAPAASIALGHDAISISWAGVAGSTYALQRSTDLVNEAFSTLESGIPVVEATNTSTFAISDESAIYRIVLE